MVGSGSTCYGCRNRHFCSCCILYVFCCNGKRAGCHLIGCKYHDRVERGGGNHFFHRVEHIPVQGSCQLLIAEPSELFPDTEKPDIHKHALNGRIREFIHHDLAYLKIYLVFIESVTLNKYFEVGIVLRCCQPEKLFRAAVGGCACDVMLWLWITEFLHVCLYKGNHLFTGCFVYRCFYGCSWEDLLIIPCSNNGVDGVVLIPVEPGNTRDCFRSHQVTDTVFACKSVSHIVIANGCRVLFRKVDTVEHRHNVRLILFKCFRIVLSWVKPFGFCEVDIGFLVNGTIVHWVFLYHVKRVIPGIRIHGLHSDSLHQGRNQCVSCFINVHHVVKHCRKIIFCRFG